MFFLIVFLFEYVIAWARGQLRINFTRIFKVFTNLENFENASEINS